ncbi:LOW QUALITY PROTEIN: hypothetical protein CFC21_089679 [Triticum aestivum]|uniref:Exocyst subunit Exo70 family protein n=2 Tax=Triticum aestivum TaxID=4565 RepID=A0A9R1IN20_WHEAT|nr:LOW QUALITY PROTEIN: hypothetical protein CFC21_089679 [Triticum aestivum]
MAGWLAAVSEESTGLDEFAAARPPRNSYRGSIRRVAVSGGLISGSGFSSGSAHAAAGARALCDLELREIARRMVHDGYTQHMVQAFHDAPIEALGTWFSELDVDWVLQIREGRMSAPSLQDLVERWVRALAIIVLTMRELHVSAVDEPTPASARFGKASIDKMLAFVDAVVVPDSPKGHAPGDKLWAVLNMYVCVSDASSFNWSRSRRRISKETQGVIDEINGSLSTEENKLNGAIFSTMEEVRTFMEEEDSWAADVPRGGGLRYLFLLNNSCFVTQQLESSKLIAWAQNHWELPPESEKYIDCYFEVSWAHVLSCISESTSGQLLRWNNGSSLARFLSAFHRIYKLQKFWKVPSPQLRRMLRKTITERVITGYLEYLEEHPELEKRIIFGNTTPDDLEEMLGELFEG